MNRWRHLSTADVLWLIPILLIFYALVAVFAFPTKVETRVEVILAAGVGALYLALIMTPFLPGRKSIADTAPPWIPFSNTFVVTVAVILLGDQAPMIAAFYLVSIAGIATRRGLSIGLWTAFLSTLGYLFALAFRNDSRSHPRLDGVHRRILLDCAVDRHARGDGTEARAHIGKGAHCPGNRTRRRGAPTPRFTLYSAPNPSNRSSSIPK